MSGLLFSAAAAVVGAYAFRSSGIDSHDGNTTSSIFPMMAR